jgi:DEAD/DEAH box helicase domain-containing protein
MCDPRDLGRTLGDRSGDGELPSKGDPLAGGFDPTIFLYDHVPGGIGLAPRLFATRDEMLERARVLIENCECTIGCPACVGAPAGNNGTPPGLVYDGAKLAAPTTFDLKELALNILSAAGLGPIS